MQGVEVVSVGSVTWSGLSSEMKCVPGYSPHNWGISRQ